MDPLNFLKTNAYVSKNVSVTKYTQPYNYVIIDNLLNDEMYNKICSKAPEYISRQSAPMGKVGDTGLHYNALIYTMKKEDCVDGFDFFWIKILARFCFKDI